MLPARLRQLVALLSLPRPVRWFYVRALATTWTHGDRWTLRSATRPVDLLAILTLADGRRDIVEIGTGTAWTAIALLLSDPSRRVLSLDRVVRPERESYLSLIGQSDRRRLVLRQAAGEDGPEADDPEVDLLFIDGGHDRGPTRAGFEAWAPRLAPSGVVVFHDYDNVHYPGVAEAVGDLGLEGCVHGQCCFVVGPRR